MEPCTVTVVVQRQVSFFFTPLTSEAKELDPSRIITPLKLVMEKYDSPDEVLHS